MAPAKAWQGGPRYLWEQIESVWRRWDHHGQPAHYRYGWLCHFPRMSFRGEFGSHSRWVCMINIGAN